MVTHAALVMVVLIEWVVRRHVSRAVVDGCVILGYHRRVHSLACPRDYGVEPVVSVRLVVNGPRRTVRLQE